MAPNCCNRTEGESLAGPILGLGLGERVWQDRYRDRTGGQSLAVSELGTESGSIRTGGQSLAVSGLGTESGSTGTSTKIFGHAG